MSQHDLVNNLSDPDIQEKFINVDGYKAREVWQRIGKLEFIYYCTVCGSQFYDKAHPKTVPGGNPCKPCWRCKNKPF